MNIFIVMVGGFLGAVCRYALGQWIPTYGGFPVNTLLINLSGCIFLGWLFTFISQRKKVSPQLSLFLGTGFTGSFTTFSTFSVETIHLFQNDALIAASLYIVISVFVGLFFVYIGYRVALVRGKEGDYL